MNIRTIAVLGFATLFFACGGDDSGKSCEPDYSDKDYYGESSSSDDGDDFGEESSDSMQKSSSSVSTSGSSITLDTAGIGYIKVPSRDDMPLCDTEYKNLRAMIKGDSLFFKCDAKMWVPESDEGYIVKKASITGAAQKGPFAFNSELTLYEYQLMDDTLVYSGRSYPDEISSNKGDFVIPKVDLVFPYAVLEVRGVWRNEITGAWSKDTMTLRALTDLSKRTEANINLLTHLEYDRALHLVKEGYSVFAAKKQAEYEIMNAFGLATSIESAEDLKTFVDQSSGQYGANGTLLAVALLFIGDRSDSEIYKLMDDFKEDLAPDGVWNGEQTKADMADWAVGFNNAVVRVNIKSWNIVDIPAYENYLTIFWNNAYGLGECAANRNGVVMQNENKLSKNKDVHYICKANAWREASDIEKDTYGWSAGKVGEVKKGDVTGAYYIYKSGSWKEAEKIEYDTYGWKAGEAGEVKRGDVSETYYVYRDGKWSETTSQLELALGSCVSSNAYAVEKHENAYYICKSGSWIKATTIEYDTYGWKSGSTGEVKKGDVTGTSYVYREGAWSEADELEAALGSCTTENVGKISKNGSTYYACESTKWKSLTTLEADTYGWTAGIVGEVKKGNVSADYFVYRDSKWNAANYVERTLGSCTTENEGTISTENGCYICENSEWKMITTLKADTYGWDAGEVGEVKKGNFTNAYYVYRNSKWNDATTIEYDTYGVNCSKDGSIVNGNVNSSYKYVCDDGSYRMAEIFEVYLNIGCTSYTEGISKIIEDEVVVATWMCSSNEWIRDAKFVGAGMLEDSRDGQVYKTIKIGSQIWMAENLNYDYNEGTAKSYCFNNKADSCVKYGRLYTWSAAMDSAAVFGTEGLGCGYGVECSPNGLVRGVCPEGWHLPSNDEWNSLFTAVGGTDVAGTKLKTTSGWYDSVNGFDSYGFGVLPAGYRDDIGGFDYAGRSAFFWSSTENDSDRSYFWRFDNSEDVFPDYYDKNLGNSVRCLRDSN